MVRWTGNEDESPFNRVKAYLDYSAQYAPDNFDCHVRRNIELLHVEIDPNDPSIARSTFLLRVAPDICNAAGNLHGGFVALGFDIMTSLTISPLAREDFWDSGHVSRTLNCTYLRPAPEGSELLVESEVVHLGRRLGMVRGVMRDRNTGKVCYACEHGKAAVVPDRRMEVDESGDGNGNENENENGNGNGRGEKAKL